MYATDICCCGELLMIKIQRIQFVRIVVAYKYKRTDSLVISLSVLKFSRKFDD